MIKISNQDFIKSKILDDFIKILEGKDAKRVFEKLELFHPSEIAVYIQMLGDYHRKKLLNVLKRNFDSRILVELEKRFLKKIIKELDFKTLSKAIVELDSDDAVDIIESLAIDIRLKILSSIPESDRLLIEKNLSFPDNSAAKLMQIELIKVPQFYDVGNVIDLLRKKKDLPNEFHEIYVINNKNILVGTVMLSSILTTNRSINVTKIMKADNFSVHYTMDKEDVADYFRKRNLTSVAVVDNQKKLMGSIYIDDIVDVIDDIAEEDILKLGGVVDQNFYDAIISVTRARFTWLMFNLVAAFCASLVIKNFESSIEKLALLAVLMPIIASMGGCAGTQSLTTAVRAIAMKQLTWANAVRSMGKEIVVGGVNGILFACLSGIITYIWFDDILISFVIAFSLFLNLVFGSFFGIFIPIMLTRFGIDPALASGTFVTMLTDIIGFFMFLLLATTYII